MGQKTLLHICFWLSYLLIESALSFSIGEWELQSLRHSMLYHGSLLIPRMIITYVFIDLLFPLSLKKTTSVVVRILLYIPYFVVSLVLYRVFLNFISWPLIMNHSPDFDAFALALSAYSFLKMITPLSLLFGMVSVAKSYQFRLRNEALEKEKYKAELKFLRTQTNPHFLFNTLNNIYALARKKSDDTADVVMKLSKILRFMLYECSEAEISIAKELKVIKDYIELEKLRYNNRLNVQFEEEIEDYSQQIAPLLLLPFIENAFKYGVSETRFDSFVKIKIKLERKRLQFWIKNSKDMEAIVEEKDGIGLTNVKRQLELLYKNQYELKVRSIADVYEVCLEVVLN